jgi:hypothetical protein
MIPNSPISNNYCRSNIILQFSDFTWVVKTYPKIVESFYSKIIHLHCITSGYRRKYTFSLIYEIPSYSYGLHTNLVSLDFQISGTHFLQLHLKILFIWSWTSSPSNKILGCSQSILNSKTWLHDFKLKYYWNHILHLSHDQL